MTTVVPRSVKKFSAVTNRRKNILMHPVQMH